MARQKQKAPQKRVASGGFMKELPEAPERNMRLANGSKSAPSRPNTSDDTQSHQPSLLRLFICVAGIYGSFLSWGVLQEALTTSDYPVSVYSEAKSETEDPQTERFTFSVFLNTVQSFFAAITGLLYLIFSTPRGQKMPPVFPTTRIVMPLILVSIASSLASPFGYASLAHIDYLTFVLAKSCKLLPVMILHLTIFRKRYPLYKYGVILLVTVGVATFTLHHPSSMKKGPTSNNNSSIYGLFLLFINLLLDGLTNTTQDHIFASPNVYGHFSGPQLMVAQNLLSTLLTSAYLLAIPHLSSSILPLLPLPVPPSQTSELSSALAFLSRHPHAAKDVFAFAACGAIGQLFIFHTLAHFSSLLLVTVTVTRKMLTMLLSVVWFGHTLKGGQWLGVGLVFGGIGAEGLVQRREKAKKLREKEKSVTGKSSGGKKAQ